MQNIDNPNCPTKDGQIDITKIYKLMKENRRAYLFILPIVFILSTVYIFSEPRTYQTQTTMAPESTELQSNIGGSLNSLAQSFGFDFNNVQGIDAISPLLYPDLMEDNGFVTRLFHIKIRDSKEDTLYSYYDYLRYHQKVSWIKKLLGGIKTGVTNLFSNDKNNIVTSKKFNPYHLSKKDDDIAGIIRKEVSIQVDKKNGLISITVEAQDPLVCKTIADSARSLLQQFITQYRTSKSRRDVEYYQKLTNEAKATYEKTRKKYAIIADANADVILESERSKQEDIENTMQLQYNTYTGLQRQLEAARAKLRLYTPAFTVVEGAAVPIKPSKPKRMIFVLAALIITFAFTTLYVTRKVVFKLN